MSTLTPTRPTSATPTRIGLATTEVRGRTQGIAVLAVIGLIWAGSALSGLAAIFAVPGLLTSLAIAAVLTNGARRQRRAANASHPRRPPAVQRRFVRIALTEVAAILMASIILSGSGNQQWIPAVICVAVGLHFIPLARLFRRPAYYVTAAALCLVGVTTMILGSAPLWRLLPCIGAAVVLWCTAAWLLQVDRQPARP